MSIGKVITNGKQAACYGKAQAVAAGQRADIAQFNVPNAASMYGLSVGFGISDVTAWGSGSAFQISVAGREVVTFSDQISDMLRPEFLPIEVKGGEEVTITFINGTAASLDAAVFARVEAY